MECDYMPAKSFDRPSVKAPGVGIAAAASYYRQTNLAIKLQLLLTLNLMKYNFNINNIVIIYLSSKYTLLSHTLEEITLSVLMTK